MQKFLLIGSIAAFLYGNCVFAMYDMEDPWREASSATENRRVNNQRSSDRFEHEVESSRAITENRRVNNQISDDRFIQEGDELSYRQYHHVFSGNSMIGQATPTIVKTSSKTSKSWSDISEIRYANNTSYDAVKNPKVILYRNKDNSCYIILQIKENKHGVIYGLNEKIVETENGSFLVYEISQDVNSFTDGAARLLYVDNTGLYIVTKDDNSIEEVISRPKEEGQLKFDGHVIKVSAIDGSITLDGEAITEDNFYDNWVSDGSGKVVLSTRWPDSNEILKNFYPPNGSYFGIFLGVRVYCDDSGRPGLNAFINKRVFMKKAMSKDGAEELVRDGTFASILKGFSYSQIVRGVIAAQLTLKEKNAVWRGNQMTIYDMVNSYGDLFKDPEFVRGLKSGFAEASKEYEHNKESEKWMPFEIVKNL